VSVRVEESCMETLSVVVPAMTEVPCIFTTPVDYSVSPTPKSADQKEAEAQKHWSAPSVF